MLTRLGRRASNWSDRVDPWTNVYGLARTLLALGTLSTLLVNHSTTLFRPATGSLEAPICSGYAAVSLFCVAPPEYLEYARWLAVLLLAIVASGWRPQLTGLLHWWIAMSLTASSVLVDGGDHVTLILTFLLIPVTLTDRRDWHWHRAPGDKREIAALTALMALLVVRIQVAIIYFHAAVGKFGVTEWANGTAVYYWFTDPSIGMPSWLEPIMVPLLTIPFVVGALTWGPLILEVFLFTGLVMDRRHWRTMLILGISFHGAIAVLHGLISFGFAMTGALVLFLRPVEEPFPLRLPFRAASSVRTEVSAITPGSADPQIA